MTKKLKVSNLNSIIFGYTITGFIVILIFLRLIFQRVKLILRINPFNGRLREKLHLVYRIVENNNLKKKANKHVPIIE